MQSMPVSICFFTVSAMAGVTLAAITTGSVISPPATRAGMSAQPLGGGKRPICEVLIRVRLRRMFPSSLVSAFDPGHDHTTDCNRTRSGADALGDGYPGGTDPIGVLTGVPAARGSGSFLTCMGLSLSRGFGPGVSSGSADCPLGLLTVLCSERERPFFVPSPAIRFPERAEGVKGPKR